MAHLSLEQHERLLEDVAVDVEATDAEIIRTDAERRDLREYLRPMVFAIIEQTYPALREMVLSEQDA